MRPRLGIKRKQTYDGQVTMSLAKGWEIFDCPYGQWLKPILEVELDRGVQKIFTCAIISKQIK